MRYCRAIGCLSIRDGTRREACLMTTRVSMRSSPRRSSMRLVRTPRSCTSLGLPSLGSTALNGLTRMSGVDSPTRLVGDRGRTQCPCAREPRWHGSGSDPGDVAVASSPRGSARPSRAGGRLGRGGQGGLGRPAGATRRPHSQPARGARPDRAYPVSLSGGDGVKGRDVGAGQTFLSRDSWVRPGS